MKHTLSSEDGLASKTVRLSPTLFLHPFPLTFAMTDSQPPRPRPLPERAFSETRIASLPDSAKAAVLIMAMGNHQAEVLMKRFDDKELQRIGKAIAEVGRIKAGEVEDVILQFVQQVTSNADLNGSFAIAEKLLRAALPPERAEEILGQIGNAGDGYSMWEQLSQISPEMLSNYLINEYPQTSALILSKMNPQQASKVMGLFPDNINVEVMNRIVNLDNVQREVVDELEKTLRNEFVTTLGKSRQRDTHEVLADIFNNFDRATETRLMDLFEGQDAKSAEKVKALMFTLDDLVRIDNEGVQSLINSFPRDTLAVALKNTSRQLSEAFFRNMSDRAARILREDMAALGDVRLRKVEEAQKALVTLAKELSTEGVIEVVPRGQETGGWVS